MTHTHKPTSTVTCSTKSSSYNWQSPPEGFSWGIAMCSSAWPQASREELKVSSQRTEFFVSDTVMKVWMPTLNPAARGISVSSATSFRLLNFK